MYYEVNYNTHTLTIIVDGRRYYLNMSGQPAGNFVSFFFHNDREVEVSFSQVSPHHKPVVTVFNSYQNSDGGIMYENVKTVQPSLSYGKAERYFSKDDSKQHTTAYAVAIVILMVVTSLIIGQLLLNK